MADTNMAYCVKCRKSVEMKNAQQTTMKNGRPAMKGECPTCGTGVYRIGAGSGAAASGAAAGGAKSGGAASGGASSGGSSKSGAGKGGAAKSSK